jgi:hypothetical protein
MTGLLLLAVLVASSTPQAAQLPAAEVNDADVERLLTAVDQARGYADLVAVLTEEERVLESSHILEWVDERAGSPSLNENQRGLLMLVRQTAIDGRDRGPREAAQLLSIRLIAVAALAAETPQQFAATLTTFAEFAPVMTPALVRTALGAPGSIWPAPLVPLMEQLAIEWPRLDALTAATRLADAASRQQGAPQAGGTAQGAADPGLVGHWRTTRIIFESARDDNLLLHATGTAERWSVTASSTGARTSGRWAVEGSVLNLTWAGGEQTSQPFAMFQGQLVLPNIANGRVFWERLTR